MNYIQVQAIRFLNLQANKSYQDFFLSVLCNLNGIYLGRIYIYIYTRRLSLTAKRFLLQSLYFNVKIWFSFLSVCLWTKSFSPHFNSLHTAVTYLTDCCGLYSTHTQRQEPVRETLYEVKSIIVFIIKLIIEFIL